MIASYKTRYDVWVEYGLQTVHDKTLKAINRAHTYKDFLEAVALTRESGIPICAHVILGLPGETHGDMMATAQELNRFGIEGVKIHLLHVLKGSALEILYRDGGVKLLSQDEYVELVSDFLEELSPKTIIQRLTGEGPEGEHVAPSWAADKLGTLGKIEEELNKKRGVISSCHRG